MSLENLAKYLMWIVFFVIVLGALYFMLKKLGVL